MNIYRHFRTLLSDAIFLVYPHLQLEMYPILFRLSNTQYGDICTPVARKIACNEKYSYTETAEAIISALNKNSTASNITEHAKISVLNGFINFRLKRSYLNSEIKSVGNENLLNEKKYKIDYHKHSELKKAYKSLLSSLGIINEINTANLEFLSYSEEIQLMREISMAETQEFSGGNIDYFCYRLCKAFGRFYNNCSLYTFNTEQTRARFLLTKAFYNRMINLLKKNTAINDF